MDTIICHVDFDGLRERRQMDARWDRALRGLRRDARAIDTRIGVARPDAPSGSTRPPRPPRDQALFGLIVRHLAAGLSDRIPLGVDRPGQRRMLASIEAETRRLAHRYERLEPGDRDP